MGLIHHHGNYSTSEGKYQTNTTLKAKLEYCEMVQHFFVYLL